MALGESGAFGGNQRGHEMPEQVMFRNRLEAGEQLAEKLAVIAGRLFDPIVLAIPRGGVPVGSEIARRLNCDLDALVLRKLPIPQSPEAGFGAVTLDRTVVLNERLLSQLYLDPGEIEQVADHVYAEVQRRDRVYRKDRMFPALAGRSVIITDDGLASGYTMLAAVQFCHKKVPVDVIVAVPVCHADAYRLIKAKTDKVFTLHVSEEPVFAVASFYEQFPEMTDEEVEFYLEKTHAAKPGRLTP
jgi:putative phosphoribosyl transferase